jgi:hypothetical protein
MDGHDRLLAAFLARDLDRAAARKWDEHLLECEQCWQAVREDRAGRQAAGLLYQPAPPRLAERVGFAVELAAAGAASPRRLPGIRLRRSWLAAAGALTVGLAVTLVVLLPGGSATMPAPVAAVAHYAETMSPGREAGLGTGKHAAPIPVGHPVTITAGGHRILIRTWRLAGTEVAEATSGQPFPMPPGARGTSGGGMAWVARVGKLSLYCINGRTSELVAASVPAAELPALAARLPLA